MHADGKSTSVSKWNSGKVNSCFYRYTVSSMEASSKLSFCIVFPAPLLAEVESPQKSHGMWFFKHFFTSYLVHRNINNRRGNLRRKFWGEKMFRKSYLKLLR